MTIILASKYCVATDFICIYTITRDECLQSGSSVFYLYYTGMSGGPFPNHRYYNVHLRKQRHNKELIYNCHYILVLCYVLSYIVERLSTMLGSRSIQLYTGITYVHFIRM